LKGHGSPQALPENDRGPVSPHHAIRRASLLFKPAASIDAFLAEQQASGLSNYHKWLTPEQFGDRFGLNSNDIGPSHRMASNPRASRSTMSPAGRHWIHLQRHRRSAARTFHTSFHHFLVNGETHFANRGPRPPFPPRLADVVG